MHSLINAVRQLGRNRQGPIEVLMSRAQYLYGERACGSSLEVSRVMQHLNARRTRPNFVDPLQWKAPPPVTVPEVNQLVRLGYFPLVDVGRSVVAVGQSGAMTIILGDNRYPCSEDGPPFLLRDAEYALADQLADALLGYVISIVRARSSDLPDQFRRDLGFLCAEVYLNRLPRFAVPVFLASRRAATTIVPDDDFLEGFVASAGRSMLGGKLVAAVRQET